MDTVTVCCDSLIKETDDAVLLDFGGLHEWLPKSQIDSHEEGRHGEWVSITIPLWLATEKEIESYVVEE